MKVQIQIWVCTGNGCQMEQRWIVVEVKKWKGALPVVHFATGETIRCREWRFTDDATAEEKAEIFNAIGKADGTIGHAYAAMNKPDAGTPAALTLPAGPRHEV